MGYRSEVVLVVGKEIMPQFMVTMAKSAEARAMCFAEHDKMIKDYDGEGNMLFAWDGIKWYDSYEEVQAIGDFMDWCESEKVGEGDDAEDADAFFRFVRTGEDTDDSECRGYGFDSIYITRSIEF